MENICRAYDYYFCTLLVHATGLVNFRFRKILRTVICHEKGTVTWYRHYESYNSSKPEITDMKSKTNAISITSMYKSVIKKN